ncbi:RidA family protein [Plastorhodobacter daqingensis]|uniref:RidA family protein n=1 Tax=Plastorhodobacter daqingensis TaxID=1387281 RepID=A0ABW2UP02_9RHOB
MKTRIVAALAAAMALATPLQAEVIRHPIPNSDFPILRAVEIPADATLVYLSGAVPRVVDETAERGTLAAYGDTEAQTVTTLESISDTLESLDLSLSDVVKMQVYLVAPDADTPMDFAGFMNGYRQFFGTEAQPNLPTRSVFQVAGLANAGWLVEIEVVAVRP